MRPVLIYAGTVAFYAFFYRTVVSRWGGLVRRITLLVLGGSDHPLRQVDAAGKLVAAGISQLGLLLLLLWLGGVGPRFFAAIEFRPDLIGFGVLLGIGEIGAASMLATAAGEVARLHLSGKQQAVTGWRSSSSGGWLGQFRSTASSSPPWFAGLAICLYVVVEEMVFRGALIPLLQPFGSLIAISLSTSLFILAQAFSMPNLREAGPPMLGAVVVGCVHSVLFSLVPDLLPLIVAHVTFFGAGLAWASRREVARAANW